MSGDDPLAGLPEAATLERLFSELRAAAEPEPPAPLPTGTPRSARGATLAAEPLAALFRAVNWANRPPAPQASPPAAPAGLPLAAQRLAQVLGGCPWSGAAPTLWAEDEAPNSAAAAAVAEQHSVGGFFDGFDW